MDATTVVYADFSCGRCYLASQLVDRLRHAGTSVQWRAIEGDVDMPVDGRPRTSIEATAVAHARTDVGSSLIPGDRTLEDPPHQVPKSGAAVSAYAEAVVAHIPDEIRDILFSAYWTHKLDIGDPEKLRTVLAPAFMRSDATSDPIKRFGYAVAMTREPITGAAWRLIRSWRQDWQQIEDNELPLVVDSTGAYAGADALRRLGELIDAGVGACDGSGSHTWQDVEQLHWTPQTTVVPPESWTSTVGDPWRRAALMREH